MAKFFFKAVLACAAFCVQAGAADLKNVFVAANAGKAESMELARAYCAARSIPSGNIIALDVPDSPNISRDDYDSKIAAPIFDFLAGRKAVLTMGSAASPRDAFVVKSDVEFLVLCKGLPYRILEKPAGGNPPAKPDLVRNNSACVDSELAMLLKGVYPLAGARENPAFGRGLSRGSYKSFKIIPVSRLDGASYSDARAVFERSIEAEKSGLAGRAYIDKSALYKEGDVWLDAAAEEISKLGFDLSVDSKRACMSHFDRFDAPALYFGWYSFAPTAYFKSPLTRLAPGASALHIYSFSAKNMADVGGMWTPNLVARGACVAFGYVDEPFLAFTHRPDIYMAALAEGLSAGEAALRASKGLSWKGMAVADPLFEPFKTGLDAQLAAAESGGGGPLSQYAVIRKMNLMEAAGDASGARALGERFLPALRETFALRWRLSQLCLKSSDTAAAMMYAESALPRASEDFQNFGLAFEILASLDALGKTGLTEKFYEKMLNSQRGKNPGFYREVLPELLKSKNLPEKIRALCAEIEAELPPLKK